MTVKVSAHLRDIEEATRKGTEIWSGPVRPGSYEANEKAFAAQVRIIYERARTLQEMFAHVQV